MITFFPVIRKAIKMGRDNWQCTASCKKISINPAFEIIKNFGCQAK